MVVNVTGGRVVVAWPALCGAANVPFCGIHDVTVGCEGQLGVDSQNIEDPDV